ncbi:MAG: aminoacyl-tRNA hydrolase [Candidatus Obscuribacterales bacterium]|nr:aminoacyl-tRNA hydrolase [Candidatus Obscuribacterales bacterium]
MISVGKNIVIPDSEFEFAFVRSGGPGGQNVNKVSSKAQLRWLIVDSPSIPPGVKERFLERFGSRVTSKGVLVLSSQRYRDQARNVEDCLEKLGAMLVSVVYPPRPRRTTVPSKAAKKRRLDAKSELSVKKKQRRRPVVED